MTAGFPLTSRKQRDCASVGKGYWATRILGEQPLWSSSHDRWFPQVDLVYVLGQRFLKQGLMVRRRRTVNMGLLILWLALGLLAAGGCAKLMAMYEDKSYEIKVRTNFDQSVDFSSFHTFAHSGMTDRGRQIAATDNKSPLRTRVKEIVNKQLVAKELRQVGLEDRPDLLVHLLFGVNEANKYKEATLVVNLAESSQKRRVWQAVIIETVGESLEKNFEMVDKGVAKAFKDYPQAK